MKTYDWLSQFDSLDNYKLLYQGFDDTLPLPKTLPSNEFLWIYDLYSKATSLDVFLAELKNVKVVGALDRGIAGPCIATSNGIILEDVLTYYGDTKRNLNSRNWVDVNVPVGFIGEKWGGTSFAHWILTCLPKLILLIFGNIKNSENRFFPKLSYFIHNSMNSKYVIEAMQLLEVDISKVYSLAETPFLKCKNLTVPSRIGYGVNPNAISIHLIKEAFGKFFIEGKKRIVIHRKKGYRKINNFNLVMNYLSTLGFESVVCEELSFLEQIQLFSQAEVVIAPHGAGLSNLVFCPPSTKVLEIFSSAYIGLCYWYLSHSNKLDYYFLVDRVNGNSKNINDYFVDGERNINVNIDDLKKMMEIMELI